MAVVEGYLPAQLDAGAIEPVVAEVIAAEGADRRRPTWAR